jgi:hypothetical protein
MLVGILTHPVVVTFVTKFFIENAIKVLSKHNYEGRFSSIALNKGEDEIVRGIRNKHQLDAFLKTKGIDPERFYMEMERHMSAPAFIAEFKTPYCKDKPCWMQGQ